MRSQNDCVMASLTKIHVHVYVDGRIRLKKRLETVLNLEPLLIKVFGLFMYLLQTKAA